MPTSTAASFRRPRARRALGAALCAGMLLATGCAVEIENLQARPAIERQAAPPGSVYTGWRVYQDRCARCHGSDATGTPSAPDLAARLRTMGPRAFVDTVLGRYDWRLPPAGSDAESRAALVDRIVRREAGALTMPEWQGEPTVTAHIADLYAYLAARAEGTQGPGRPMP